MFKVTTNLTKVLKDWETNTRLALKAAENTTNEALLALYNDIVKRTPVGNPALWRHPYAPKGYKPGKLKASWQFSKGNAPRQKATGRFVSSASVTSNGGIQLTIKGLPVSVQIYNTQPYAQVIEDGWSGQAPQGMVKLSLQNFKNHLDVAAKRNKL